MHSNPCMISLSEKTNLQQCHNNENALLQSWSKAYSMCKSVLKHFFLLISQLDITVVYGWTYIGLSSLNAKSMIQMWSWLQTDVSRKSLRVSCYTVAWYYVQGLLQMSRSFYFIFSRKCWSLYSLAITLIYLEEWLLKKRVGNSVHIMNTEEQKKKKTHLDYSHILCQYCVTLIPCTCIMPINDNKCKKIITETKNHPYV